MAPDTPAVLRVDLEDGSVEPRDPPTGWGRRFVGGNGLAARSLYEEPPPGADPLGPENVLLFAVGPLTGRLPAEQRSPLVTRSTLTGRRTRRAPCGPRGAVRSGRNRSVAGGERHPRIGRSSDRDHPRPPRVADDRHRERTDRRARMIVGRTDPIGEME